MGGGGAVEVGTCACDGDFSVGGQVPDIEVAGAVDGGEDARAMGGPSG